MELFVPRPVLLQKHARLCAGTLFRWTGWSIKIVLSLYKQTAVDAAIRVHLWLTLIVL